ncbi:hypothetical protein PTKIN_Ptkin09bG0291800 [Pterospermum kingtungense]
MDRNAIATTILLFLIFADVSIASSFWKLRYLADESPPKNDTAAASPPSSPSPSPLSGSGAKKSDPKPDSPAKLDPNSLNKTDSVTPPPDDQKNPTPSDNKTEKVSPPPQAGIHSGNNSNSTSNAKDDKTIKDNEEKKKNVDGKKSPNSAETEKGAETKEDKNKNKEEEKKTNGDENESNSGILDTCDGVANNCTDGGSLTACIKSFGTGPGELFILVHNSGEKTLKVNPAGPIGESFPKGITIPKHGTKKINISSTVSKNSELVLNAGSEDCVLRLNPLLSEGNFFLNLPSYDQLVTPINGAYFLIVTVVIFGGSWACCMFRKRRRHDGIPYQELEMGLPGSMAATEVETAEGWDQVWDDDWDENNAVKSPGGRHVANISANGLTARSSNRDGWENDWDD